MSTELRLVAQLVHHDRLAAALADPGLIETESAGVICDLSEFRRLAILLVSSNQDTDHRSKWDARLAVPLHRGLAIPRRLALDFRFWQWLAICECADLVWKRWHGEVPEDPSVPIQDWSLAQRFIGTKTGGRSLNAFSRHALARLWWCCEHLKSDADGYELVPLALSTQDFYQAIFDRELGLYPAAARACVRAFHGKPEGTFRRGIARLNHLLTTITLEGLSEHDIMELLEARPDHIDSPSPS